MGVAVQYLYVWATLWARYYSAIMEMAGTERQLP